MQEHLGNGVFQPPFQFGVHSQGFSAVGSFRHVLIACIHFPRSLHGAGYRGDFTYFFNTGSSMLKMQAAFCRAPPLPDADLASVSMSVNTK